MTKFEEAILIYEIEVGLKSGKLIEVSCPVCHGSGKERSIDAYGKEQFDRCERCIMTGKIKKLSLHS